MILTPNPLVKTDIACDTISRNMIVVTGATGFIGRRLAKELTKNFKSSEILCLIWDKENDLERSGREILRKLHIKTKRVDLVTKKGLNNLPLSPEIIIHLAANPDTNVLDHRCNDIGTQNLYEALRPGPNTHFIHTSTMIAMSGRKDCSKPFDEKEPLSPSNEYTRSKQRSEKFLIERCLRDKFKLTIIRPNTVIGSGYRNDSLIDFMKKRIKKGSIFTRLNWPGLSSLIFVEDVAYAIVALAKKFPKPGKPEIYYLHGENLTLAQISESIHKALNIPYRQINLPNFLWGFCKVLRGGAPFFEKFLNPRIYNFIWRASIIVDHATYCKTNKLSKTINWKPKKFEEIIKEIV